MSERKRDPIDDLFDLLSPPKGRSIADINISDIKRMKAEVASTTFLKRMKIIGTARDDAEARKLLRGLENGIKEDIVSEMIKMVSELHIHQPYAFSGEAETNCVGKTRFIFIMANTHEDMETMIEDVLEANKKNPLPKLADLPDKLRDRFTRYREVAMSLKEEPEDKGKDKPKTKAVKIPIRDA